MAEPNTNDSNIIGSGGGGGGGGSDSDQDFDPSAEMLVNDFDDEHTMDEEEALADDDDEIDDELTNKDEIEKLNQEKDIPIEELLRMYGYDKPTTTTTSDNVDQSTSDSSNSNNLTSQTQTSVTTAATTAINNNINQLLSDSSDDDSDEDFSVNEDEWRRTIQVGSDFQAVIPDGLKHYEHDSNIGHNNILLWKPPISLLNLDEYLLEYAKLSLSSDEDSLNDFVLPTGAHIKDDEQALFTLFQCKYDMKKALYLHENDNETKAPISEPMTPWSEEECRAFESGLRALGKDFYQIKHSRIPTRSVGEVVSFYYLWKKTERHDIFANKFRIEKKKYSLHPGTTDYMDRFLDEQENVSINNIPLNQNNNNSTLSTSSNVQMNSQQPQTTQNNSSNHHNHNHGMTISLQQPSSSSSSSSNRQSLHSRHAQQTTPSSSHYHQHHPTINNNNTSMSLGRTIQVSNEPQTILINDYHVSSNDDKPIVVCTGGGSSSNHGNYYGSNSGETSSSSSNTKTIVVGKNPIMIDGTWVSSSSSSSSSSLSATSSSATTANLTPSVSIYKIPHTTSSSSSSFNR
uniref:Mesoderm induction early response protein 1-like isoform X1 n=1 Tax=Dermatophagoides pteronyssinus TaxID=6956 RepID=A0A6P6XSQ2_DERPT|nr:mesoderm induction early response protein 1-like isoform X1 [Dermatophagoides pteronyssinus]